MAQHIFKSDVLARLAAAPGDRSLFGTNADSFWANLVTKDHATPVAERHAHEADIYLVLEGEADLLLGGDLVDPSSPSPGQTRGTALVGADRQRIAAGDLVHIPPGVAHLVDARESRIVYVVVKESLVNPVS